MRLASAGDEYRSSPDGRAVFLASVPHVAGSAQSLQLADLYKEMLDEKKQKELARSDAPQQSSADARAVRIILAAINALAGQLYVSWDKLLLDVDRGRDPREEVRIVRTKFPDSTLAHGETTSEERWEPMDSRDAADNTGMVTSRQI
jgi:hypothetical protein